MQNDNFSEDCAALIDGGKRRVGKHAKVDQKEQRQIARAIDLQGGCSAVVPGGFAFGVKQARRKEEQGEKRCESRVDPRAYVGPTVSAAENSHGKKASLRLRIITRWTKPITGMPINPTSAAVIAPRFSRTTTKKIPLATHIPTVATRIHFSLSR